MTGTTWGSPCKSKPNIGSVIVNGEGNQEVNTMVEDLFSGGWHQTRAMLTGVRRMLATFVEHRDLFGKLDGDEMEYPALVPLSAAWKTVCTDSSALNNSLGALEKQIDAIIAAIDAVEVK